MAALVSELGYPWYVGMLADEDVAWMPLQQCKPLEEDNDGEGDSELAMIGKTAEKLTGGQAFLHEQPAELKEIAMMQAGGEEEVKRNVSMLRRQKTASGTKRFIVEEDYRMAGIDLYSVPPEGPHRR